MTSIFLIKLEGKLEKFKYNFQRIYKQNDIGTWTISISASPKEFTGIVILVPKNPNIYVVAEQIQLKIVIRELKNDKAKGESLKLEDIRAIEIKAKFFSELIYTFDFRYTTKSSPSLHISKSIILMVEMPTIPDILNPEDATKLKKICDRKENCDVRLIVQDRKLKAHKAILEKCEVFKKMFDKNLDVIQIDDVEYDVLVEMCRFLYCNDFFYKETIAKKLIVAAKNYMITDLVEKCEEYLIDQIDFYNAIEILIQADQMKMEKMRDAAIDYIISNRQTFLLTPEWGNLKKNYKALVLLINEKIMSNNN